ncbi:hypothetical protein [Hymenobacter jejuensis]|uniref:Uncharacterized protein n=1 Tax=Hymenobacter jejuensis TaxID=2502781 RepID=A0A5B7ZW04_9BACT|nr:hypothetical protein [Hymenobacter jejuensis]QDA59017.1 hypothetical protein FHG12_02375 [Hymenobacter jejuensis]
MSLYPCLPAALCLLGSVFAWSGDALSSPITTIAQIGTPEGIPTVRPAVLFQVEEGELDFLVMDVPVTSFEQAHAYDEGATLHLSTPVGEFVDSVYRQQIALHQFDAHTTSVSVQLYFIRNAISASMVSALEKKVGVTVKLENRQGVSVTYRQVAHELVINSALIMTYR